MTKKKSLVTIFSILTVLFAVAFAFSVKPTANATTSFDKDTYTYKFVYSEIPESWGGWDNRDLGVPDSFKNGTLNDLQLYDFSNVSAMTFTVNNTNTVPFKWTLGIYDETFRNGTQSNQWLNNYTGSTLYIPENGQAYWAQSGVVPAGFKGRIVLPFQTIKTSNDLASSTTNAGSLVTYSVHQNPVFKIRGNASYSGLFDTTGVQRSFPSSTMRAPTMYVSASTNSGITNEIAFNNIEYIDAVTYGTYLKELDKFDVEQLKNQVKNISMDDAVLFNVPQYKGITYKQNAIAPCNHTLTAIGSNSCAIGIRIKVTHSEGAFFDFNINEISGETLFLSSGEEGKDFLFIHADGTIGNVKGWGNGIVIPAGWDGTLFIGLSDMALVAANNYGCIDGRWAANTWLMNMFNYNASEYAIGQFMVVKYNNGAEGATYTVEEIKATAKDGTVYNAKNQASYETPATKSVLTYKTATLTETTDGETSTNATLSVSKVYYSNSTTVTIPKILGKKVALTVDGANVDLTENANDYTYRYENRQNVAGEIAFAVAYETLPVVTYVDANGVTQTLYSANGKVTLPTLSNDEGEVFVGYKGANGIYQAGEIDITNDMDLTPVFVDMDMVNGASIRYTEPAGLRFTATVDTNDYAQLGEISLGMVITRTIGEEVTYLDAVATLTYAVSESVIGFNIAVTGIKDYTAIYEARAYIKVNFVNGGEIRVYCDSNDNARSVQGAAQTLLAGDVSKLPQPYIDTLNKFAGNN